MEVGDTRTIKQRFCRKECEYCEELATHKLTFLLPGARGDPQSAAFHRDDCSWCSDEDAFVCEEHKNYQKIASEKGLNFCSDFSYERFKHMFEWWEEVKEK